MGIAYLYFLTGFIAKLLQYLVVGAVYFICSSLPNPQGPPRPHGILSGSIVRELFGQSSMTILNTEVTSSVSLSIISVVVR